MPKRQIVVFTGFNRAQFKPAPKGQTHFTLTEDWISQRFGIWRRYTWQSILNQTYKDWVYCMCCNKDAKAITDKYFKKIKDPRFFLTYSETEQERNVMRKLAKHKDEMINVRLDSDDMYHKSALDDLWSVLGNTKHEWFQWQRGYGYKYNEVHFGTLKIYKPGHKSGPFFAHRYKRDDWVKKGIVMECQHQWVRKKNPIGLSPGKILVGICDNTSTHINSGCFKRTIFGPEKRDVLKGFGIT